MHDTPPPWQHGVVLVCTNERGPGAKKPSCGRENGQRLRAWLKESARAEVGPVSQCRVLETSCLDVCPSRGVAVAMEPGHRVLVVDPEQDKEALFTAVKGHMDRVAAETDEPPPGPRDAVKRVLGRLRGGQGR